MTAAGPQRLWLLGVAALACACSGMGELVMPTPFALSRAHPDPRDDGGLGEGRQFLPWATDVGQLIVVDKTARRLALYRRGRLHRAYPVVLGRSAGRKVWEGDHKTPSGVYRVTDKRRHPKYDRFLDLSYPNAEDLANYRVALSKGLLPKRREGQRAPGPGALIGIHGSDKEDLNRVGVNWTYGCVSLMNRDIEELYQLVEPGTLVLIQGDEERDNRADAAVSSAR
jgi:murein L,D-transpeptidase YafK